MIETEAVFEGFDDLKSGDMGVFMKPVAEVAAAIEDGALFIE